MGQEPPVGVGQAAQGGVVRRPGTERHAEVRVRGGIDRHVQGALTGDAIGEHAQAQRQGRRGRGGA